MSAFKKPAKLKLSLAQWKMFSAEIEAAKAVGDCSTHGFAIVLDDYEGAQALLGRFMRMQAVGKSTRSDVSWNSVVDRLNKAITDAIGGNDA